MSISENLAIALTDVPVEPVAPEATAELALESMLSGGQHAMTEIGASPVGVCVFLCSCCCCCG
jgi:hypothetical protein